MSKKEISVIIENQYPIKFPIVVDSIIFVDINASEHKWSTRNRLAITMFPYKNLPILFDLIKNEKGNFDLKFFQNIFAK